MSTTYTADEYRNATPELRHRLNQLIAEQHLTTADLRSVTYNDDGTFTLVRILRNEDGTMALTPDRTELLTEDITVNKPEWWT